MFLTQACTVGEGKGEGREDLLRTVTQGPTLTDVSHLNTFQITTAVEGAGGLHMDFKCLSLKVTSIASALPIGQLPQSPAYLQKARKCEGTWRFSES